MKRKRRCRNCGELFRPHPRLKAKQRYCSGQPCQNRRQRLNEKDWLERNPEVLAYKRAQTREWFQSRPAYSRLRRRKNPGLETSNRLWSRQRMRAIRSERRFDKTKSILTELTQGKGDKCYLTRGIRWLHIRLTKPSRWSGGKALWENAARLRLPVVMPANRKVYDVSEAVFGRAP